jgi:ElaB/YqjD/DUF883 family membrane-anchored ribosome-binding protein
MQPDMDPSEKIRARGRDALETAQETLGTAHETTRETGAEALKSAQATGQAVVRDSADLARDAYADLNTAVRRNPTLAIVGAMGVGMLLGLALGSRR